MHRLAAFVAAATITMAASAFDSTHYAKSSVLSSGHWVKIKVTESGIQQITFDQLKSWGLDPANVSVYGYGGVAAGTENFVADFPDDIIQQPIYRTEEKIVFYGEADARSNLLFVANAPSWPKPRIERNHASDAGYYFVTDSRAPQEFQPYDYTPASAGTLRTFHKSPGFVEEEVQNYGNAGQLFVGHDISNGEVLDLGFTLVDRYIPSTASEDIIGTSLTMAAIGSKPWFTFEQPRNNSGKYEISASTFQLSSSPYSPTIEYSCNTLHNKVELRKIELPDNFAAFKFYKSTNPNVSMANGALDNFAYYYLRKNNMGTNSSLTMLYDIVSAGDEIMFTNVARNNFQVWNVTNAYDVRPYKVSFDTSNLTATITPEKNYSISTDNNLRLIAFYPTSTHHKVECVGVIDNQDLHSMEVPDLLIISSDLLYDYACQLADLHRRIQGMDVIVVRQDQIFNEFGGGNPSTSAIRRCAKMFYDRNPQKFRSLLLFGGGSNDNRGITGHANAFKKEGALLLTYGTVDHSYQLDDTRSFTSDCYFGMLADDFDISGIIEAPMQINVGRIPARNYDQAQKVINKIESYLTNLPSVDIFHRAVIAADDGDSHSHLKNAENFAATLEREIGGMTNIKAYVSIYPIINGKSPTLRDAMNQSFNMGTGFFGYSGHGSATGFAAEEIMNLGMIKSVEYDFYPFAALATCDSYPFDRLMDNIAETMVFAPHGGMIGVIGSSRTVYADRNQILFEIVGREYGNAGIGALTGDIMRRSRNAIVGSEFATHQNRVALLENTLTYNYCGDPALPLYFAPQTAVIESVNGTMLSDNGNNVTMLPGATSTIKGYVGENGKVDTSFNGSVILSLYEAPRVMDSYSYTGNVSVPITLDEDLLCQSVVEVKDGEFTAEMTVPFPTRDGAYNRLTVYAYTSDLKQFSANWTDKVSVAMENPDSNPTDVEGPVITGLWINSEDFVDGDIVGEDITVLAHIEADESGLLVSTGKVGASSRLLLDATKTYALLGTSMTYQPDGSVDISCPVSGLAPGNHSLILQCYDNLGNSSQRSILFTVHPTNADAVLAVDEKTGHTEFNFTLEHSFAGAPSGMLVIEDFNGDIVYKKDVSSFDGVVTWDITDGSDKFIPDGIYRAFAVLREGNTTAATKPIELTVIQKQ